MGIFSKNVEDKVVEEEDTIGVVLHFLPHLICIYVCKDDSIDFFDGAYIEMMDLQGNYIGVSGTIISLEIKSMDEFNTIQEQYGIKESGLPVKVIEVQEY